MIGRATGMYLIRLAFGVRRGSGQTAVLFPAEMRPSQVPRAHDLRGGNRIHVPSPAERIAKRCTIDRSKTIKKRLKK